MNANEVFANRANEILTAINMADREEAGEAASALGSLPESQDRKTREFALVLNIGRTQHLQDAVPMTLGQEFSGYGRQVQRELLERCFPGLEELAIGGTAIGTGLNAHSDFAARDVPKASTSWAA
jgi:fumarate hydratase, class II